jgi:hypothetical protein
MALQREEAEPLAALVMAAFVLLTGHFGIAGLDGP